MKKQRFLKKYICDTSPRDKWIIIMRCFVIATFNEDGLTCTREREGERDGGVERGGGGGTCRRRALHRRDVTGAPEQSGGEATSGRAGKDGKEGKIEEIDKRRRGNGNTARDRAFHLVSPRFTVRHHTPL